MSLISDALEKARKEREKISANDNSDPILSDMMRDDKGSGLNKRFLFYGFFSLMIILTVVILLIWSNSQSKDVMKVLNVKNNTALPAQTPATPKSSSSVITPPPVDPASMMASTPSNPSVKSAEASGVTGNKPVEKPEQKVEEKAVDSKPNLIKKAEMVAADNDHLKFEIVMSKNVDYELIPVNKTSNRLAIDLKNTLFGRFDNPVERLNVKKFRGNYNSPSTYRIVFDLYFLKEYKVYASNNVLTVEFSGAKDPSPAASPTPATAMVSNGAAQQASPSAEKKPESVPSSQTESKPSDVSILKSKRSGEMGKRSSNKKGIEKVKETPKSKEEIEFNEWVQQGDNFASERNYFEAAARYKSALQIRKTPELFQKIYGAYWAAKNPILSRAYLDEGIKAFPENLDLLKNSAILYIRNNEYTKPLEQLKRVINKRASGTNEPGPDYHIYYYLGICYFHAKDYQNAFQGFKKSLEMNSDANDNYYYIGLIFDQTKDYVKASDYYNAYLKLARDEKDSVHKSWVTKRIGEIKEFLKQ